MSLSPVQGPRKACDIDYQREELHPSVFNALSLNSTIKNTTVRVESKTSTSSRLPVIRYAPEESPSSLPEHRIDEMKPYTTEPRFMQLTQNSARLLSDRRYHRDAVELRVQREADLSPSRRLPYDYSMEHKWSHKQPPRKVSPTRTSPLRAKVSPPSAPSQTIVPSQPSPSSSLSSATYTSPYSSRGPPTKPPAPRATSPDPKTAPSTILGSRGADLEGTQHLSTTQLVFGHVGTGGCVVNPYAHTDARQPLVLPHSHPPLLPTPLTHAHTLSNTNGSACEDAFEKTDGKTSTGPHSQCPSPSRAHTLRLSSRIHPADSRSADAKVISSGNGNGAGDGGSPSSATASASGSALGTPSVSPTSANANGNTIGTCACTSSTSAPTPASTTDELSLPRYMRHNASSRLRHDVGIANYLYIKHHCDSYGATEQCAHCGLSGIHTAVAREKREGEERGRKGVDCSWHANKMTSGQGARLPSEVAGDRGEEGVGVGVVCREEGGQGKENERKGLSRLNAFGNSFGKYSSGNPSKRGLVLSLETDKPKPVPHYMTSNAITQLRLQEQCRVARKEPWELIMSGSQHLHGAAKGRNAASASSLARTRTTATAPVSPDAAAEDYSLPPSSHHRVAHYRGVDAAATNLGADADAHAEDSECVDAAGACGTGETVSGLDEAGAGAESRTMVAVSGSAFVHEEGKDGEGDAHMLTLPSIQRRTHTQSQSRGALRKNKHQKHSLLELSAAQRYTPRPPSPSQARYGFYTMPSLRDLQQKGWGMEIERSDAEEDSEDEEGVGRDAKAGRGKGKKAVDIYDETFVVKGRGPWPLVPKNMGESMFAGYTKHLKYLFPLQGAKK